MMLIIFSYLCFGIICQILNFIENIFHCINRYYHDRKNSIYR